MANYPGALSFYGIGNVIRGVDTRAHAYASGPTEIAAIEAFLLRAST